MNKRRGHVVVTTEVAVCSFCGRPRTLRHEQHQLGTLVRTIVTCETCHRTLSSSIAVASEPAAIEPGAIETQTEQQHVAEDRPADKAAATPKPKPATAKPKAAASKPIAPAKRSPSTK